MSAESLEDEASDAAEDAHEQQRTTTMLWDLVRRLMNAAEEYMGSEPEMPSHDRTVDELEEAIAAAHAVLDLPPEPDYER